MWYHKVWLTNNLQLRSKCVWTSSHDPGVWSVDYSTGRTWMLKFNTSLLADVVSDMIKRSRYARGITGGSVPAVSRHRK